MGKVVVGVVIGAFVLFYVVSSPTNAADIVHHAWHGTVSMAHGVRHFIDNVSS